MVRPSSRAFFQGGLALLFPVPDGHLWLARLRGFWRLQAYCLRMRPTWEGWYWTPKWRRIIWATLGWVQPSPRKPRAWGPWVKSSSNWSRCWWVNLDRRPVGLRWRRAWGLSALARLSHCLMPLWSPPGLRRCAARASLSGIAPRRAGGALPASWLLVGNVVLSYIPVCQPFTRMFSPIFKDQ
jgi:hypothetical protein